MDQLIIPKLIFSLFSSLIWLISKEKSSLIHSWELELNIKRMSPGRFVSYARQWLALRCIVNASIDGALVL